MIFDSALRCIQPLPVSCYKTSITHSLLWLLLNWGQGHLRTYLKATVLHLRDLFTWNVVINWTPRTPLPKTNKQISIITSVTFCQHYLGDWSSAQSRGVCKSRKDVSGCILLTQRKHSSSEENISTDFDIVFCRTTSPKITTTLNFLISFSTYSDLKQRTLMNLENQEPWCLDLWEDLYKYYALQIMCWCTYIKKVRWICSQCKINVQQGSPTGSSLGTVLATKSSFPKGQRKCVS